MKTTAKKYLSILAGLSLAMFISLAGVLSADDHRAQKTAVSGGLGWNIVPPAFTPQYLVTGTDGDTHIRHMPLVGGLTLTGRRVSINGKFTADLNGELDSTLSGPLWGEVTITSMIGDVKTLIFEGRFTADAVGLVSIGKIKVHGRGPYEGATLNLTFEEIGPGNSDSYNLNGYFLRD